MQPLSRTILPILGLTAGIILFFLFVWFLSSVTVPFAGAIITAIFFTDRGLA